MLFNDMFFRKKDKISSLAQQDAKLFTVRAFSGLLFMKLQFFLRKKQ